MDKRTCSINCIYIFQLMNYTEVNLLFRIYICFVELSFPRYLTKCSCPAEMSRALNYSLINRDPLEVDSNPGILFCISTHLSFPRVSRKWLCLHSTPPYACIYCDRPGDFVILNCLSLLYVSYWKCEKSFIMEMFTAMTNGKTKADSVKVLPKFLDVT